MSSWPLISFLFFLFILCHFPMAEEPPDPCAWGFACSSYSLPDSLGFGVFFLTALWEFQDSFSTPTGLLALLSHSAVLGKWELLNREAMSQHSSPWTQARERPGGGSGGGAFLSQTRDQTSQGWVGEEASEANEKWGEWRVGSIIIVFMCMYTSWNLFVWTSVTVLKCVLKVSVS